MTSTISWVHVGDLHADDADTWAGIEVLERVVADLASVAEGIDFVFLPGDNGNHARPEEYRRILAALEPLATPVLTIPGDHDFEDGTLAAFLDGTPERMRPFERVIGGHRLVFLDIVSAGSGGPDFRIGAGQRRRLEKALAESDDDAGLTPLVFMHAFPSDLADGGEALATLFADARVAFVDTGHTHYNELLNDGRVVYGATRSSAQIEEDGGTPGYSIVSVHDGVPSWTFRPLVPAPAWPHVQILTPADLHLATRTHDPRHVPSPGAVEIVARVIGPATEGPVVEVGNASWPMTPLSGVPATWRGEVTLPAGLTAVTVRCDTASDTVEVLARDGRDRPMHPRVVAPGNAIHTVGTWPSRHLLGSRLGPNRNGRGW